MKVLSPREAAALIPHGATIAFSGGGYRAVAESMLAAIRERHDEEPGFGGLRVIAISMIERTRGGVGGEGTGLNRLATPGLMTTLISGSFSRARDHEVNVLIGDEQVAAYNIPMGTIVQWLRAIGSGRRAFYTEVGLGTFVDPRIEGGRANAAAAEPLSSLVEIDGVETIRYPRLTVDAGLVKARAADERGNLYLDSQAYEHGAIDVAMAARASGGVVIAEVDEIVGVGERHPRFVRVPGALVDIVVPAQSPPWEDEQAPLLTGAAREELPPPSAGNRPRDVIAALAVDLLPESAAVNVGAGIPMYDVPEAARRAGRDDLYFTIEHGAMGGWPQVGGVSRNPEGILGQLEVFQYYEGGGPDVSVLSFGQIDRHGNVNVSRFGSMMPGCGGFTNIVHGVRRLIFCGTLTTGGAVSQVGDGRLDIVSEGSIARFVDEVEQITFNAARALDAGHEITVVTDRGIFEVTTSGFELVRIAPGVELRRDVLDRIAFEVRVSPRLEVIDAGFFEGSR